MTELSGKAARS